VTVQRASKALITERLGSIIETRLSGDAERAEAMLAELCEIGTARLKEGVPKAREAAVLLRDHYTCRYCGYQLLSIPVLRAIHELFPTTFRWHPNWKTDEADVTWWRDASSLDHVIPRTRGGTNNADNLVASCWPCNSSKGNLTLAELGRTLSPIGESDWDGYSGKLSPLVALLPADNRFMRYFREWERAIGAPEQLV
jgi:5-methylcytosine-specific restriction endonuclease McrA